MVWIAGQAQACASCTLGQGKPGLQRVPAWSELVCLVMKSDLPDCNSSDGLRTKSSKDFTALIHAQLWLHCAN